MMNSKLTSSHPYRAARCASLITLILLFAIGSFAGNEERRAKSQVSPAYPELARKMRLSGAVKVQVEISPSGTVTSAKALGGHPVFIDSAINAARKWRFEASPVATSQIVVINFVNNERD